MQEDIREIIKKAEEIKNKGAGVADFLYMYSKMLKILKKEVRKW